MFMNHVPHKAQDLNLIISDAILQKYENDVVDFVVDGDICLQAAEGERFQSFVNG